MNIKTFFITIATVFLVMISVGASHLSAQTCQVWGGGSGSCVDGCQLIAGNCLAFDSDGDGDNVRSCGNYGCSVNANCGFTQCCTDLRVGILSCGPGGQGSGNCEIFAYRQCALATTPTTAPNPTTPPACGTCNPGPGCPPACGSSCGGTCSGNGQACTIFGPACPSPTCSSTPGAPSGLAISIPSPQICTGNVMNNVTLSWNALAGAASYSIRIDNTSNGWNGSCSSPNAGDTCIDGLGTNSYTGNFTAGVNYNWWVHGANTCGSLGTGTNSSFFIPGTPTGLAVACQNGGTQASYTWNAVSGATGYSLRINRDPYTDWYNSGAGDQFVNTVTNSSVRTITPSTNYQNSVQSVNGSISGCWGNWQATVNCPATVTPTPTPVRNASCVSHTIPTSMLPSTVYPVSVTMNNTGNSAWSSTAPAYLLGSSDPQANTVWGLSSTPLDVTPVNAGQNTTFNFDVTSPSTPGTYSSRWRMFQNTIAWFGADCGPVAVVVANPTPTPTPRCDVSMPVDTTIGVGGTTNLVATLSNVTGTVDRVTFATSVPADVSISTTADSTFVYQTTGIGVSSGFSDITATCYLVGSVLTPRGSDVTRVTVLANSPTPTPTPVPCQVTTSPANMNLDIGGDTGTITASVTSGLGSATVTNMAFGSYNTGLVTVSPTNDATAPTYSTTATSTSTLGSTAVWATATLSDGRTCESTATTDTNVEVVPVCSITVPTDTWMSTSATTPLSVTLGSQTGGTVTRVEFLSSNTSRVTATSPDNTSPFSSTLTSTTSVGTATVTANAYMNSDMTSSRCTDSTTVHVSAGPTVTLTPTPTSPASVNWTITTAPYCSTGGGVTAQLRMFRYLGPLASPVYTQDSLASGNHAMTFSSTSATDVVWVGMKDASGNSYEPTAITPADPDVSFGQDFTPAVWNAQWDRGLLPAGNYQVDVRIVPSAPDSPTANSNPVAGSTVTLNWAAPTSWGMACNPNNTYEVYFSQEAAGYSGYPNNAAPSPAPNFTCNASSCTGTPSTTVASTSTSTTFAVSPGLRYCWTVVANNGVFDGAPSNARCFDNVSGPWWQAAGGEAIAATGQLQSPLPGGEMLIEALATGRPGMAFGESLGGSLDGATNISTYDWWVDLTGHDWGAMLVKPENTYQYMRDRLLLLGNPSIAASPIQMWSGGDDDGTKATVVIGGQTYYLYRANAPVTVQGLTNSGRKVILMVDGAGTTTLGDNLTFSATGFGFILSQGGITVQPNVTALQGIYFTDGVFDTGSNTNVLTVNGTVIGMQGVTLGRTGGGAGPSELFSFRPDFTVLLNQLGLRKKIIQELVNP